MVHKISVYKCICSAPHLKKSMVGFADPSQLYVWLCLFIFNQHFSNYNAHNTGEDDKHYNQTKQTARQDKTLLLLKGGKAHSFLY